MSSLCETTQTECQLCKLLHHFFFSCCLNQMQTRSKRLSVARLQFQDFKGFVRLQPCIIHCLIAQAEFSAWKQFFAAAHWRRRECCGFLIFIATLRPCWVRAQLWQKRAFSLREDDSTQITVALQPSVCLKETHIPAGRWWR